VTAAAPAKSHSIRNRSSAVLLAISAAIALAGIGFAAGRMTSPGNSSTANGGPAGNGTIAGRVGPDASGLSAGAFPGDGNRGIGGAGASTVTGIVVSVSGDSITVKLADGSTTTIALSSSTTYHVSTTTSSSSVSTGATVTVAVSTTVASAASSGSSMPTRTATDVTITSN
jgi:hypothetical protein